MPIWLASFEGVLADLDEDTYSAVWLKHPIPHSNACTSYTAPSPYSCWLENGDTNTANWTFIPNGCAGGPEKLKQYHLKIWFMVWCLEKHNTLAVCSGRFGSSC